MASDHLLLVKSARFREEYKRFYFCDIQAIVAAEARCFHISTRTTLIAVLWLLSFAILSAGQTLSFLPGGGILTGICWIGGAALMLAWVYISAAWSCRCRIYTAVSSDELPSLYRVWTVRRFLRKIEPYITQAQGAIEGNAAEAVEDRQVGPLPEGRIGLSMPGAAGKVVPPPSAVTTTRNPVSTLFVASLCLGGLAELATFSVRGSAAGWILFGFILIQIAAAVAVLVQNYIGRLASSLRKLAIIALVSVGAWYYAAQIGMSIARGYENAKAKRAGTPQHKVEALSLLDYPISRGSEAGLSLLLGLAGVILLLRGERSAEDKVPLNA
jgi:hypothetical protein